MPEKSTVLKLIMMLLALPFLAGCGAHLRSLPVGERQLQVNASAGGPLVDAFGTTVPIPYGMLGATYGVTERVEVYIDAHATAAAFRLLAVTPGAVWFPDLHTGPWVPSLGADVMVFSDFDQTRAFPELTTALARPWGRRWTPYIGLQHTFQTTRAPAYMLSPYAGTLYRLGRAQLAAEVQWLDARRDNRWNPVDYHGIGHRGALGVQLGMTFDVGGVR